MKTQLALAGIVATAIVLILAGVFSPQARATTAFAQQTGVPCGGCHLPSWTGDRKLTAFGERFKANGNKLPQLDKQSK
jgi:hypothetical protein